MLEDRLRKHYARVADSIATTGAEQHLREFVTDLDRAGPSPHRRGLRTGHVVAPVLTAIGVLLALAAVAFNLGRSSAPTSPAGLAGRTAAATFSPASPRPTAMITAQFVVHTAIGLLPTQGRESDLGGSASPGLVSGNLRYTAGQSSSYLVVEVGYPVVTAHAPHPSVCASPSLLPSVAQRTTRNDGSSIIVVPAARNWLAVYLCRSDGVSVSVIEKAADGGDVTLDSTELAAIVTSGLWQTRVPADQVADVARIFVSGSTVAPNRTATTR